MDENRSSGFWAPSAAGGLAGVLGARGRCISQVLRNPPSSVEALRVEPRAAQPAGGFHPRAAAGRVPTPTSWSVPNQCHLQTQTPDECLKITMLPCLPLWFFLMHVGWQPIGPCAILPIGVHWLGSLAGGGF